MTERKEYEIYMWGNCNWDSDQCSIRVHLSVAERNDVADLLKTMTKDRTIGGGDIGDPNQDPPIVGLKDALTRLGETFYQFPTCITKFLKDLNG